MSGRDHDSTDTGPPTKRRRTRSPSPFTAVAVAEAKWEADNDGMDVEEEFEFDEDDENGDDFDQDGQSSVDQEVEEDGDDGDDLQFQDISLPCVPQCDARTLAAEDEDEDLDFEDVAIPPTSLSHSTSELSIPIPTNLSTIEFTLPLDRSESQASENSQKKRRAITKADRIARLTLHRLHLLSLLASAHLAHRAAYEDDTVYALAMSLIPPTIATSMRLGSDQVRLGPLITWLRSEFTADPMLPWPDGAEAVRLAIANRVGHPCALVLAVAALLWRVVGVKARLVAGLNPIPLTFQCQATLVTEQDSSHSQSSASAPATKSSREVLVQKAAPIYPLTFALEVPKGHGEWTPLHFNWTVIDHMTPTTTSAYSRATASRSFRGPTSSESQPHPFDTLKSSGGPYFTSPYVLTLTHPPRLTPACTPRAKDVSVRYLTGLRGGRPVEDPKFRVPLDDPWWSRIVSTGAGRADTSGTALDSSVEDQYMLEQLLVKAPFPTRLADYKDHRVYALERHLCKDEVVYPKEPVLGKIKGEMIYPRANVKQVRSERVWVRQFGRQIKAGERPVKETKSRAGKWKALGEDGESRGTANGTCVVGLFGEWQTEPYASTSEVDPISGDVPTNEHGNVELFHPSMVPRGGAHVTVPNAKRIAKDLGIPYAEAMTGFDFASGGRTRPTIHGIVVAAHAASIIEEAATNIEAAQHEQELASRKHRIAMQWVMFAKGLVAREQVKRLFARTGAARPVTLAEATTVSRSSADRGEVKSVEGEGDLQSLGQRLRKRQALRPVAAVESDESTGSGDDDIAHPEAGGFVVSCDSESEASNGTVNSDSQASESDDEEWDDLDLGPRARRRRPVPHRPEAPLPPSEGGGGFL